MKIMSEIAIYSTLDITSIMIVPNFISVTELFPEKFVISPTVQSFLKIVLAVDIWIRLSFVCVGVEWSGLVPVLDDNFYVVFILLWFSFSIMNNSVEVFTVAGIYLIFV